MSSHRPRLIRRAPLAERIKSAFNPFDILLRLSEWFSSSDWDEWDKQYGFYIGLALNLVMFVARASVSGRRMGDAVFDDVFGDEEEHVRMSFAGLLFSLLVYFLTILSILNAVSCFHKRRYYRLFEKPMSATPSTPSAHRVRVNASPTNSPLQFVSSVILPLFSGRVEPTEDSDVWELALWDPSSISLRLFCLFSPGHVLLYFFFVPFSSGVGSSGYTSVSFLTLLLLLSMLSLQLTMLHQYYAQHSHDSLLLHRELMHEYDTKFVYPRTQCQMRDVATQFYSDLHSSTGLPSPKHERAFNSVKTGQDVTIIRKGFETRPNPNYSGYTDPDGSRDFDRRSSIPYGSTLTPLSSGFGTNTFSEQASKSVPYQLSAPSTSLRTSQVQSSRHQSPLKNTAFMSANAISTSINTSSSDGGSLGVYSHANSPLRKKRYSSFELSGQRGFVEKERARQRELDEERRRKRASLGSGSREGRREGSPLKRMSLFEDVRGH